MRAAAKSSVASLFVGKPWALVTTEAMRLPMLDEDSLLPLVIQVLRTLPDHAGVAAALELVGATGAPA